MFAGSASPSGWLTCDGAAVNRTTYAALFAVIGTTYGAGNGTTTFNLPDMRGRAPIGVGTGSGLTARALADEVGAETHTLSVAEMPSHTHTQFSTGPKNNSFDSGTFVGNDLSGPTGSTGGDAAHNNMQPSLAVNFIIKI
jgi:microcystin-dependent protein